MEADEKRKRDTKYYMEHIPHEKAVQALERIAEIVSPYGTCSWSWDINDSHAMVESVSRMIDEIAGIKDAAEKLLKLRDIWRQVVL